MLSDLSTPRRRRRGRPLRRVVVEFGAGMEREALTRSEARPLAREERWTSVEVGARRCGTIRPDCTGWTTFGR